jgi:hypothetical protein
VRFQCKAATFLMPYCSILYGDMLGYPGSENVSGMYIKTLRERGGWYQGTVRLLHHPEKISLTLA